ncbi:FecR domain-containing protein [Pseudophaeobacter flagellatus]|uniref:FecR domain-containing protein n=1 Tax=Pseudophaeobacter flagellatus TaxID=2899119 RepID=UPI001E2E109E|nr:FecR domain-containing protein [Pseudophaeobacter flagellatus]MCD9147778.1 FecR domain-containing protein [Pseudophaeobacter flagellatus]
MKFNVPSASINVRLHFAAVVVGLTLCSTLTLAAEPRGLDAPMQIVRLAEGDSIRGVVGQYLNDPDLWPTVLEINDIASVADLVPGMTLKLPVQQVQAADAALTTSLAAIQKATSEGAGIFAPRQIGSAIENRDAAVAQRQTGSWRKVVSFATIATDFAVEALEIALAQRDKAAEALVSDVQGTVEGRTPVQLGWSGRKVNDILVEFERMRTLSNSTTQITFRDLSRLRLNPNSNATIQRMRSDPLTGGEVTKVSLVNGDFYALLNQLSEKTSFEIEVPGVQTNSGSGDFWVKNDPSGARFVNYDDSRIEITRNGESILLGENEGAVLGGQGIEKADVLVSPVLLAPPMGGIIYTKVSGVTWQAFDQAEAYWLEIASDPGFNHMQISEWGIRETRFDAPLPPARYHWRVAALDQLGLPGQWSKAQDFTVRHDKNPPFLTLLSPGPAVIVARPFVEVLGATETDALLTLNGAALDRAGDGSFATRLALKEGPNTISVVATDPAGNTSTRSQTVTFRPAASIKITLDPTQPRRGDTLATRSADLSVFAQTTAEPDALARVRDAQGEIVVQTRVTDSGGLRFTVPARPAERSYQIEVLGPKGAVEGRLKFTVLRDQTAPEIDLDLPPPRATSEAEMDLSGFAGDATALELNGSPVTMTSGRFALDLVLQPGLNIFELAASDAVGNVNVKQFQSVLDLAPPEILAIDFSRPQGVKGPIELKVAAKDASGLRQAAPFIVAVGGTEIEGFMRCDSASGLCRTTLPPQDGALRVIELIIEDYAGNTAIK